MPSDPTTVALDELVDLVGDKVASNKDWTLPYVGLEQMAEGSPDLLGSLPATASVSVNGVFRSGDILFGKLRPNLRKSVLTRFSGYCSTDILVLRPKTGVVPEYAAKVFQFDDVFSAAVGSAEGTKMPRTSWDKLRRHRVRRFQQEQQRRIADILDAADEAIRQTEAVIAKLKLMKDGLLHDLLTRGLDAHGRLRQFDAKSPHFKTVDLREIFAPRREHGIEGLPVVSVTMRDGLQLRSESERRVESELSAEQHALVRKGDLAYNMMRMWQGACGVARFDCLISPAYVVLAPKGIDSGFAYRLFKWPDTILKFHNRSRGLTDDRLRLYYQDFARIPVRIPTSIDEQRRTAEVLDAHDARIAAELAQLDKLKCQKTGLMHDLLTGRVPVASAEVAKRA